MIEVGQNRRTGERRLQAIEGLLVSGLPDKTRTLLEKISKRGGDSRVALDETCHKVCHAQEALKLKSFKAS